MTDRQHTLVIGAGHNGLICAAYLARAGHRVTVLEASDQVGGAARTREFAPGFSVSAGAHLMGPVDATINRDLKLESHGLALAATDLATTCLGAEGEHLTLAGDTLQGAGIGAEEGAAYHRYRSQMQRFADLLKTLYYQPPPRLAPQNRGDYLDLGRIGWRLRRLGKCDMRDFLRVFPGNIYDVLEEHFQHPMLKGALALDAVTGNHLGPRSNGTVFNALHRLATMSRPALPKGGLGTLATALKAAAESAGASVRLGARVQRILLDDGRVRGVDLADGEEVEASTVVSGADPKTTFLTLLGAAHLEAEFAWAVNRTRARGNVAKLHLALDGLPRFTGLPEDRLGDRLLIAPSADYVERAFNHAKYGRYSTEPALEITVPTVHDESLAPDGEHVLSALVQYAPYALEGGWDQGRKVFEEQLIQLLERHAPGIGDQIVAAELLTPVDMEKEFGVAGGHWHHGELTLDQAFMLRPAPRAANYRAPVDGLYLCGAGCHPGGGVHGLAGRNAAQAILEETR